MRDVWCTVEELIDAVATIRLDHAAVPALSMLLDHRPWISEEHARLHKGDGLIQTLASSFRHPNRVGFGSSSITDVVGFVEISMKALVIQGDVDIDDIAIEQDALVRDAMTDDLVG